MSTLPELIAHRDTAGARYVAAVTELRAAFGDLGAIERLLENAKAGYPVPTFGGPRPNPIPLRHPKYLPKLGGSFQDDVLSAYAVRAAAFGVPDEE
jgi:hypothetical protein